MSWRNSRAGWAFIAGFWLVPGGREVLLAQAPQNPAFEVASVKSNKSATPPSSRFPLGPGDAYVPGNLFSATNQPLIAYLRFAFKISQGELLDVPTWVYDEHFDIAARAAADPSKDEMRLMMRSLLIDRFGLKVHRERRTKPAFNLVLVSAGKVGPQLKRSVDDEGCAESLTGQSADVPAASKPTEPTSKSGLQLPPIACGAIGQISASSPAKGRIGGRRVSMERIAAFLTNPFTGVDRAVVDRTGLSGAFDFSLEWSLESVVTGADQATAAGPNFFEALRSQLGLKLVATKAPSDTLIIDRIERPNEN
jgi:uncharacterized protein (TIGR03435 family)